MYILYMYIYIILYISHSGGEITQLPPDSKKQRRIIQVQRVEVLKNLKGSHTSPPKSNKKCVLLKTASIHDGYINPIVLLAIGNWNSWHIVD